MSNPVNTNSIIANAVADNAPAQYQARVANGHFTNLRDDPKFQKSLKKVNDLFNLQPATGVPR